MAGLEMLQDVLLLLSAFGVGVAGTLAFLLYRRIKQNGGARSGANTLHNMTEMSIMFQTMRGLVREQKQLAKDFNRSLDAKVEVVREAVRQVIAGHEHLMRLQKEFKGQLEQASGAGQETAPDDHELPPLQAIAVPEEADLIENWQPLPAADADEDEPAEPPAPEPESDPEAEREAMSALLNMGEPAASQESTQDTPEKAQTPATPTNGAAALRSRVYKYHDAGMSVSAIAQELGLGKGEIRLMLSLRGD